MEKFAVLSDIHGNLEALLAVLEDIDAQGIADILCLGDVVGYGPDPAACLDLVRQRCRVVICGNHDEAVIKGPWGFNQAARTAVEWTRRQLRPRFYRWGSRRRWRFLQDLPIRQHWGEFLLVHGSPRDPTTEYLMPHHASWPPPGLFEEVFGAFETVCFVGHTHVPGVFVEDPRFTPQSKLREKFQRPAGKMVINVGSVGQPRDRDSRSCYLVVDGEDFEFRRVEYDFERTQRKIRGQRDLDDRLADRLGRGD